MLTNKKLNSFPQNSVNHFHKLIKDGLRHEYWILSGETMISITFKLDSNLNSNTKYFLKKIPIQIKNQVFKTLLFT